MTGTTTFVIDGRAVTDIASFYAEINRVFMAGEDWTLGHSLDGLNDLFHGGYGAMKDAGAVTLVWRDMAHSRDALGVETTRAWLLSKLDPPARFDMARIDAQLRALDAGIGKTYFDLILEVIGDHPDITLMPA